MSELALWFIDDDLFVDIKGIRMPDGVDYWSIFDFINLVCSKTHGDAYGRATYHELVFGNPAYNTELSTLTTSIKFPGGLFYLSVRLYYTNLYFLQAMASGKLTL